MISDMRKMAEAFLANPRDDNFGHQPTPEQRRLEALCEAHEAGNSRLRPLSCGNWCRLLETAGDAERTILAGTLDQMSVRNRHPTSSPFSRSCRPPKKGKRPRASRQRDKAQAWVSLKRSPAIRAMEWPRISKPLSTC